MSTEYLITMAEQPDALTLTQIVNAAYRGEGNEKGWTTESHLLGGLRVDLETMQHQIADPKLNILKYVDPEGCVLGTVCLEVDGKDLHLGMFAVDPATQGKGVGKALMKQAETFGLENNCSRIVISVIDTRSELIDWYIRHGYLATGGSISFEQIPARFGDPKVDRIELMEMEKLL